MARIQVLLAMCLLAKCFGNCEGKEEKKDSPRAAQITDPAKNEAKPFLEVIDFVPLHPRKAKEHWFNLIITFGRNNHPEGRNDGFPEIVGVEPAKNMPETAKDNNTDEWLSNSKEPVLCVTVEEKCLLPCGVETVGFFLAGVS